jgi:hypothetical protein
MTINKQRENSGGWIKQGAKAKFMSLSVRPKDIGNSKAAERGRTFHDDSTAL